MCSHHFKTDRKQTASSPSFRPLTKNRGEGELSIVPTGIRLAVIPSLFSSHLHSRISFFQSLAHSFIFHFTPIPYPSSTFRTLFHKTGVYPSGHTNFIYPLCFRYFLG